MTEVEKVKPYKYTHCPCCLNCGNNGNCKLDSLVDMGICLLYTDGRSEDALTMKKYYLNNIIRLRETMDYPSDIRDDMRVDVIKIYLEAYFSVEMDEDE